MKAKKMFISADLPTDSSPSLSPKKPVRKGKKPKAPAKAPAKATDSSPPRKKKKHQATTSSPVSQETFTKRSQNVLNVFNPRFFLQYAGVTTRRMNQALIRGEIPPEALISEIETGEESQVEPPAGESSPVQHTSSLPHSSQPLHTVSSTHNKHQSSVSTDILFTVYLTGANASRRRLIRIV